MDEETRTETALWRLGVLGPLISARLDYGDRTNLFDEAAERTYETHDGRRTRLKARTVEAWYYAYRSGGFEALKPRRRSDAGRSRAISQQLAGLILAAKRENPRRSIRRLIKMLEREGKVRVGQLSKSSVHRLLQAHGLSRRSGRYHGTERRAFRHAHAGDLWMGDVMHGPQAILPNGRKGKSYLHVFIDSATRLVPGCAFRPGETAADHEAVLKQALLKHGLPRVLYLDRGAAQISRSLKIICAELGIRLLHCRPYDPAAKGAIERLIRTWREEVGSELPDSPLPLDELNSLTWAWIAAEYHRRVHSTTHKAPLDHWLSQADHVRPAPRGKLLDEAFLHRAKRKVRKDSTLRFGGKMLEVRPELCGLEVELRFDPERPGVPPRVFVDGQFHCDTTVLDPVRNSSRRRRRGQPAADPDTVKTGLDPLKQIQDEHCRRARPPRPETREE
jgi:transposase InsO family protein